MKKIICYLSLSALSLSSFSQTQIANGDFENWSSSEYCSALDSLDNFLTGQAFFYLNAKNETDAIECPALPFTYKTTDKQSGSYALKLGPQYFDDKAYYNFVTLGEAAYFEEEGSVASFGIPFTGRPSKLTGYYKCTAGAVGDELQIKVFGSNFTSEDPLFYGVFTASENQPMYEKFEIDLVYDPTDPNNAVYLSMLITVGNLNDGSIDENTVAFIDNLVFEYDATAATSYTPVSPIHVFASNKTISFSEHVSDIHVVDMVGANNIQEAASTKTLHAETLNSGLYIVTYNYKGNYFSKKVVIE
ncbi:T9SS type A sorting domain-containing protein [Cytophaga hutchinsonii]|uniref:Secretion system C-terminal sorting domain-containing protein n=1 Tax=Cytophaga hutchinsonii (strain ATCC 33406 / DSM 1761 / CIP 103989 / NBRC 15051 / NCIMB 9469 / D465) TaxID=269798 RepID=A0A6N4SNB2_CYTH3|nr:T9SS type A sorting domain-containing protein [Cytophaga hutchinsonii]ABG57767.1 hypothetical protein CHU_0478 [Cytophaga hutchinsonii ATCC 33406]SFX04923.1 Por secretion system C-terminal sorting domain-containing protein [Cytophaga hutchinsonii ATCC 33406]